MSMIPYRPARLSPQETSATLDRLEALSQSRRSVRMFSSDPVSRHCIEQAIRIAGTAPSGAHRQPWHFVAISNQELKAKIREATEAEEREFYERRITPEWRALLEPLGTDFVKSHITEAPWVVVVFRRDYDVLPGGERSKNYYMTESVGIAVGFFISALHQAGLATLTHTPAPMTFLREICGRPLNEKPFVLMPVGYPHPECVVPDLARKDLSQISDFL